MLSVIIGRFQTPHLHEGHLEMIRQARNHSDSLLILIGCTSATGTDKNPLDFDSRKGLFQLNCPVLPLYDNPCDKEWSTQIDKIIKQLGFNEATIFGGRDNSIEGYYTGKHEVKIIDERGGKSATALRNNVKVKESEDFRSGIIYNSQKRYPIVYSTVDVAIYKTEVINPDSSWERLEVLDSILMGKKGDKFMFIGGFVDPEDETLYHAACRELKEETGLTVSDLTYKFSQKVNDLRYKDTKDCIMTHFFSAKSKNGDLPDESKISDKEFSEFRWFPAREHYSDLVADCHKPLFLKFINLNR